MNRRSWDDYSIKPKDSLKSLFGEELRRNHEQLKDNPVYCVFQSFFKKLRKIAERNGCAFNQHILLISHGLRKDLEEITFKEFDEVESFVSEHASTLYKFYDYDFHSYLFQCGYFEISSTAVAGKDLISKFFEVIRQMKENKCTTQQFREYGILVAQKLIPGTAKNRKG